jgi:predicted ATPase
MAAAVEVLEQATRGQAMALLVSGEAGVGKTVLVRAACSQVSDIADVLWGSCLPLTSLAVPFLPLRSALREWAGEPRNSDTGAGWVGRAGDRVRAGGV